MCKDGPDPQNLQSTLDSYAYLGICVGTRSLLIHIGYSESWYQDSVVLMTSSYKLDETPPKNSCRVSRCDIFLSPICECTPAVKVSVQLVASNACQFRFLKRQSPFLQVKLGLDMVAPSRCRSRCTFKKKLLGSLINIFIALGPLIQLIIS